MLYASNAVANDDLTGFRGAAMTRTGEKKRSWARVSVSD